MILKKGREEPLFFDLAVFKQQRNRAELRGTGRILESPGVFQQYCIIFFILYALVDPS